MKRRRLAYLALEAPRPGQASHTHVTEIVACLAELGWDCEIFTTEVTSRMGMCAPFVRLSEFVRVQKQLISRLAEFDVLFVRAHPAAFPSSWFAQREGLVVTHEINGQPQDLSVSYPWLRPVMPLLGWTYRVQFVNAQHLFAVTPGLVDWARAFSGHDRLSLVTNGANTSVFKPRASDKIATARSVVFVGGLVEWHGIPTMIAATKHPDWPADVRLVIVGDGPKAYLLDGRGERVDWLGRVPYDDVPDIICNSFASICAIENPEGRSATGVAPIKLYEAMACGVPVIVTDLPFQADLVQKIGSGVIVPTGDPGSLARAVATLANDREYAAAMGQRGAAYVKAEGSWQDRAAAISAVLEELVNARP